MTVKVPGPDPYGVEQGLRGIVAKATAPKANDRHQDAGELGDDLKALLVRMPEDPSVTPASASVDRPMPIWVPAVVVLAVLVLATVLFHFGWI
jgi:hypothetical protein